MDAILVIGRILFSLLFLTSGMAHLMKFEAMAGYAKYKKVPATKLSVAVSGLMIITGGLFIIFGVYADLGALLIVIFLIPTAFIMHNFWKETDPTAKQTEMTAFLKDLALAGAALILLVLIGRHADIGPQITGPLFNFK